MNSEPAADAFAASDSGQDVTSGNPVFYLNGRRNITTPSSVPISSSGWLNDMRVREWISTESLRRNGHDYPLLFGLPTLMQAVDDISDVAAAERLVADERARNPAFDRWMEEGFVSTFTKEDLRSYPEGSVGRQLFDYMDEHDLSPELNSRVLANPDWKPANSLDFWNLRMGQTHDFYHILGEIGFGSVAEYFITGVVTGNCFRHLGPELAGTFMTTNTLIMFPWMTRTMLHYPGAWSTLWRNLTYGYEIGQQSDMLFTARFETVLAMTPAEAREALGWRGFHGPTDSREASLVFGEGREIIP
ncbi:Ubiquinone biosynthesis protein Coq4 [Sphingomonas laterariae]|uniref:Ubiquinone biosynthesis protein Coq4 n=1 Tax=Edaphosphingomonas laterariae TaxID=861865 RepID=A0A239BEN9_9SPHN|nr:Coq4 family protein [Sphingomonas laterariae]SNS06199.1 Ubiquinone biosynthesis protein Coq4 [Sphingomonas laterariae]